MDIIKFPRSAKTFDITPMSKEKLLTKSPMKFTCDCGNGMEISCKGMLFRHMEFYCSECGTPYKVTNPAFKAPPVPKIK